MKTSCIASAIALIFSAQAAATGLLSRSELETVVVTADRSEQHLDDAAPNVAVVNRADLTRAAAQNLDDTALYEPGVEVPSDNSRRGNAGYNIRGIDGNRILMMVDGVRIPELYAGGGGNGAISGRDLLEPDTLKQIEIVKGPYSALYGSDALGGVVNMATYQPSDWVDAEKPVYFGLKYGYRSANRSHGVTATAAARNDVAEGLLMLSKRRFHETESKGSVDTANSSRTVQNPQDGNSYNILAKGNIGNERHRVEAVFEQFRRKNDTNLQNGLGSVTRGAVTTTTERNLADDRAKRQRIELGYRYIGGSSWLEEISAHVYRQKLDAEDDVNVLSSTSVAGRTVSSTRVADYDFSQTATGIHTQLRAHAATGSMQHQIVAGAEFRQTETGRLRDNTTTAEDGTVSKYYAGELFPNKTFPDSKRRTFSLYAQDSLVFTNGVTLTPALRYEHEKLKPEIDEAYLNSHPSSLPQNFSDGSLTPSLRLSVPMGSAFTGFATYSRGFRTPPFDSATMAFSNNTYGYQVIPNNHLQSEHSNSFELGLKYKNSALNAQITTFYNRYSDFINRTLVRTDVSAGRPMLVYQYDNLDKVKTYGTEAALGWQINPTWKLSGAIAWMRGKDGNGAALDTAYPLNGVVGLDYAQEKWGAGGRWRWAARQKRTSDSSYFKTPGYGVVDISAWYSPVKNVELNAGLFNVGDKKYWQHADVSAMADNGAMDLYSQPGRNVALGINIKF